MPTKKKKILKYQPKGREKNFLYSPNNRVAADDEILHTGLEECALNNSHTIAIFKLLCFHYPSNNPVLLMKHSVCLMGCFDNHLTACNGVPVNCTLTRLESHKHRMSIELN
jgi:hypothetical protein